MPIQQKLTPPVLLFSVFAGWVIYIFYSYEVISSTNNFITYKVTEEWIEHSAGSSIDQHFRFFNSWLFVKSCCCLFFLILIKDFDIFILFLVLMICLVYSKESFQIFLTVIHYY